MIKANELRIGNYILFKQFGKGKGTIGQMKAGDFGRVTCDDPENSEYHPIPLTPDWLERCGFEYMPFSTDISMYSFYKKSDLFELIIVNKGIRNEYKPGIHYYNNERHPVFFVHQLQNLYFALIGEELNVKL